MILWTIQNEQAYLSMLKTGTLRADEKFVYDGFSDAYSWMMEQMTMRIGKAPDGVVSPVWAWYQWVGKRKRPDMRTHGRSFSSKGVPIALITVDVPDKYVLLSDFDYWHVVLNNGDLIFPLSDVEYPEAVKKKSLEKIFDISCAFDGEEHLTLSTQATLWEIKQEWVQRVEHFISR